MFQQRFGLISLRPPPLLGWKQLFHTLFLTNNFSTRLNPMQNFILPMECSFSSLQLLMGLRNGPKPLFGWKQLFQTQFLTNKFSTGPNWIIITPSMNTYVFEYEVVKYDFGIWNHIRTPKVCKCERKWCSTWLVSHPSTDRAHYGLTSVKDFHWLKKWATKAHMQHIVKQLDLNSILSMQVQVWVPREQFQV